MNYTLAGLNVSTYNPDTHKVVPKDAVVLTDHDMRHWKGEGGRAESLLRYAGALERSPSGGLAAAQLLRVIAEQVKPPRIPEPGLWGVVKDAEGSHFLREGVGGSHNWVNLDVRSSGNTRWVDIKNPVLIRPGIE